MHMKYSFTNDYDGESSNIPTMSRKIFAGSAVAILLSMTVQAENIVLEEVLVTATKTGATDLQNTPITITAISGGSLHSSNISNLKDLVLLAPGISVSQNTGWGQLYIRGIGTNNVFIGGDPSSTIHLDGVYLGRAVSVFSEFLDLERVEVLRGPQGTLYGRNSTGGTVNLITNKPTDSFFLESTVSADSENRRRASVAVSGPLIESVLSARLALLNDTSDGAVDNISLTAADSTLGAKDRQSARIALRYRPHEQLSIDVSADYFERDETPPLYHPTGLSQQGAVPTIPNAPSRDFFKLDIPAHPVLPDGPQWSERTQGVGTTINWKLNGEATVTTISSYRRFESALSIDADYTSINAFVSNFYDDQHQFSQELRVSLNRDQLSLVTGVFYFTENHATKTRIDLLAAAAGAGFQELAALTSSTVETHSFGLFADSTVELNEKWDLLVGIRYSDEEKDYVGVGFGLKDGAPHPPFEFDSKTDFSPSDTNESWDNLSFKLGTAVRVNDNMLAYSTLSTGFKSGGYGVTTATKDSYDEEQVLALEVGAKVYLPDAYTSVNTSVFYYDYSDLQISEFVVVEPGEAPRGKISNASDATVYGFELELATMITGALSFNGSLAYLSTEYDSYHLQRCDVCDLENVSGNALNSAPEWAVSLAASYRQPLPEGSLLYNLDGRWQDEVYFSPFNDKVMSQSDYALINAHVSYTPTSEDWSVQLYGTNLTDKEYSNSGQDFSPTGVNLGINQPRVIGVKVMYRLD